MKIITISFEIQGETIAISSSKRIESIVNTVKNEKPDILLGSGYSLDTNNDLVNLAKKLRENESETNVVIEVKYDDIIISQGHPLKKNNSNETISTGTHCLYLINSKNEIVRLGAQIFAQSENVSGKTKSTYIEMFHQILEKRSFNVNGEKVIALCCGEINVIQGRDKIKFISEKSENILKSCDIVLNPTHDCMANYGTLKAKRRFLSKLNNSNSVYVSSSNWNTEKKLSSGKIRKQRKENSFIQNVYKNGTKLEMNTVLNEDMLFVNSVIVNN